MYDMYGVQRSYGWAVNKYGVRVEQIGGWGYHCGEWRERSGPSSLDVWVYRANGLPASNVRVEFHWPGDMAVRYTEVSGKAGFGYGSGSWIWDPAVGGPHWLVVTFPADRTVSRVVVYWNAEREQIFSSRSFEVQLQQGEEWATVAEGGEPEPTHVSVVELEETQTTGVRIYQPEGGGSGARPNILWVSEVEAY